MFFNMMKAQALALDRLFFTFFIPPPSLHTFAPKSAKKVNKCSKSLKSNASARFLIEYKISSGSRNRYLNRHG